MKILQLFSFAALLILLSCNSSKRIFEKEDLLSKYDKAVQDAKFPENKEISSNLVRINKYNEKLDIDDQGRVLFVCWTNWDGYKEKLGGELTLSQDVWVTAVPELKDFCRQFGFKYYIDARLEQVLGLPPQRNYNQMVEFYAHPQDVFRPCPDPEITDGECELEFPNSPDLQISERHRAWMQEQETNAYQNETRYPWTRLGYTYDWGNPKDPIGLSEFVVRKGASVQIRAIYSNLDYCKSK